MLSVGVRQEFPVFDATILIEKIRTLPADRIAEVEDFIEFLIAREQERTLTRDAAAASAPTFAAVWSNPDDDIYVGA